jgi:MOSC domain-containing protein YiiM
VPARLVSIYTAPAAGAPVVRQPAVRAVAGRGLEGDRYWQGEGSFSRWPGKGRDVTLIAAEAVREAEAEFGVSMAAGEHRRNLVVEGVTLADLRGVRFQVGEATFEGVRLCAPCKYLVRVTGQPEAFEALVGRGGLRAAVVKGGEVREGDAVAWDPADVERRPRLPG